MNRFDRLTYRYLAETFAGAALYVLASYLARPFLETHTDPVVVVAVSFAATLPMGLALWAQVRFYRKVDERERHILAVAGALTLLTGVFLALFLDKLGMAWPADFGLYATFLMIAWSVATVLVRLRS
ncbi:hypothetical protein [Roseibium marinum]|uniref:Uncharacterized protein n=1 Tax=Roseibium marinum TaxID=281252 RepID=A0A2S3UKD1_9HYPH|nr:hypothetical protein [Roseibium marinum]POF28167.1 hypothetical protein CLV41_11618 [Roseibium marinum]